MADRRYRCTRCVGTGPVAGCEASPFGLEFVSAEPRCPRCQVGPPVVFALRRVHFYAPDPQGPVVGDGGSRWRIACQPDSANPAGAPATGEADAVTCEGCRATREWQLARDLRAHGTFGGVILD